MASSIKYDYRCDLLSGKYICQTRDMFVSFVLNQNIWELSPHFWLSVKGIGAKRAVQIPGRRWYRSEKQARHLLHLHIRTYVLHKQRKIYLHCAVLRYAVEILLRVSKFITHSLFSWELLLGNSWSVTFSGHISHSALVVLYNFYMSRKYSIDLRTHFFIRLTQYWNIVT